MTQADIAEKIGVSSVTVSKALRDHSDIFASMKDSVRINASSMDNSPNLVAASLSMSKSNTIGVVIPEAENSFFTYLTNSIIDAAIAVLAMDGFGYTA